MNNCKTCKHWLKTDDDDHGEVPGTGRCKAVVQFWDATRWDDYETRTLKPEYAGKPVFVRDGSDYFAALKTFPDFGCVQHAQEGK